MTPDDEIEIPNIGTFRYNYEECTYRVMENGEIFGLGYQYDELEELTK